MIWTKKEKYFLGLFYYYYVVCTRICYDWIVGIYLHFLLELP